ncbi:MAG TPA: hypothetical protein VFU41_06385 [Gemmatimonadales bacterium]|nr:hypothetical protein [Gemmatimonadales bacterium]
MRGLTGRIAITLVGLVLVASMAEAQRRVRGGRAVRVERPGAGPRLGYDFDIDHAVLGGQFNFPVGRRWALVPSADFYLGVNGTPYRINADLKYHPPTVYGFFYFGGGLAILHASGTTDTGANVFAGWEGRRYAPVKPFVEARFVFSDATSFNILGGINVPI